MIASPLLIRGDQSTGSFREDCKTGGNGFVACMGTVCRQITRCRAGGFEPVSVDTASLGLLGYCRSRSRDRIIQTL
jgi:hypothetical protein